MLAQSQDAARSSSPQSSIRVDADRFWRDGYLLVKGVFSRDEIAFFRKKAYEATENAEREDRLMRIQSIRYPLGDLLSMDGLRDIILDPRVHSIGQQILGADPIYFGYSSMQIGGDPRYAPGWHKDNRLADRYDRRGLDWTIDRYPLIRMGVYFQDHARHSGGVAIRRGSHRTTKLWRGKPRIISSEPGDLVVWSMRTTHSGHATRLTFGGDRAMGGRWMRYLPKRFKVPEESERVAAFLTLAREGDHLERYIEHLKTVRAHDELLWFQNSRFGEDVWRRVKASGLTVRSIIPEYGTPRPEASKAASA
jgi:hypothetical protein